MTWAGTGPTDTGGSEILSYVLEMDDGAGGDFRPLTGGESTQFLKLSYTVYEGIAEGATFRFRFRARNAVGWSAYSPIVYIEAASRPGTPPPPRLTASSSTGLMLALFPATEDGGASITSYKIFRDDGNALSASSYAL